MSQSLETRRCPGCEHSFRVMPASKSVFCSQACMELSGNGDERKIARMKLQKGNAWPYQAKKKSASPVSASVSPSDTSARNSSFEKATVESSTKAAGAPSPSVFAAEKSGGSTRKPERESHDRALIVGQSSLPSKEWSEIASATRGESANMPNTESSGTLGTREIAKSKTEKRPIAENAVTPRTASIEQYLTTAMVESPSMNLIDDTANHLHGLMKGMTADKPPADIRVTNPEVVNAAVGCGKTIYQLMRLKLDALKFGRKIAKDLNGKDEGEADSA